MSHLILRVALVSLAATSALPADVAAKGRRACLSEDLVERLQQGDTTDTSVIVSGTQARVDAIAARHGLRIRKRLRSGAVLDVPAGSLRDVASDPDIDALSGSYRLRAHMGRFHEPVRPGDTITARAEVVEVLHERKRVRLKTTCSNQHGTVVLSGEAIVMPPRSAV